MGKPKVGRNEPCPCGSGKKYKKCCARKETVAPAKSGGLMQAATTTPYLNPSLIAQQWMAAQSQSQESNLKLVLDRYQVRSEEAAEAVRALGKQDGDTVLFYRKKQWIGEADLSKSGEIVVTTAHKKEADTLKAQLTALEGVIHKGRTEDKFEGLESSGNVDVADEMKQFKVRFFKVWMDEPNERLEGKSPRQATKVPSLKARLRNLVTELEEKEAKLAKKERYSFKGIKKELEL